MTKQCISQIAYMNTYKKASVRKHHKKHTGDGFGINFLIFYPNKSKSSKQKIRQSKAGTENRTCFFL